MNTAYIRSGVIAGVIAVIIWTVISLIAGGMSGTYIATWAVILFLIGLIGTMVISSIMERRHHPADTTSISDH